MSYSRTEERWSVVEGFPGYRVSTHGKVMGPSGLLAGSVNMTGYLRVAPKRDGRFHSRLVHRLVLETFVGPRPEGWQCRHLDANKLNNRLDNLCWGTPQENMDDAVRHGTVARGDAAGPRKWSEKRPRGDKPPARRIEGLRRGSKNGHARLTESDIPVIRERARSETYIAIAADYGVTPENIYMVVRRKTWRHVK
jgi:hypothetical protein